MNQIINQTSNSLRRINGSLFQGSSRLSVVVDGRKKASEKNNKGGLRRGREGRDLSLFLALVLPRFFLSLALFFCLSPTAQSLEQAKWMIKQKYMEAFTVLISRINESRLRCEWPQKYSKLPLIQASPAIVMGSSTSCKPKNACGNKPPLHPSPPQISPSRFLVWNSFYRGVLKLKKILRRGFRATLNFRKFKVALNPLRRIFLNFAKSCILSC